MTETQRKFLTEYLGECWRSQETYYDCEKGHIVQRRTFTDLKDKQDLLEKVIEKGEWDDFINIAYQEYSSQFPFAYGEKICMSSLESRFHHYYKWLILLSPEETAELICKWKGQPDGLTKEERK
jgi:hypothetical protein